MWVPYYISLFSLSKIIFIPIASGPPYDFLESGPTESLIQMMRTITELKELKDVYYENQENSVIY